MKFQRIVSLGLAHVAALAAILSSRNLVGADSDTVTKNWSSTTPTKLTNAALTAAFTGAGLTADDAAQFKKDGKIPSLAVAKALIGAAAPNANGEAVILDIVEWADNSHSGTAFHQWYVYDKDANNEFTWESQSDMLDRTCIPARQKLSLVYIYLQDSSTDDYDKVKSAAAYTIKETKEKSQFVQDIITLLGLLSPVGVPAALSGVNKIAALITDPETAGCSAYCNFEDSLTASTISIGATYGGGGGSATSPIFDDEPASIWGLSALVPVNSYKDVVLQNTSNNVSPKSVTRQTAYIALDVYMPPEQPQLTAIRWLPDLFIALPASGKVFEHPMAGSSFALKYKNVSVDLFYGVVVDWENQSPTGQRHVVKKGTAGLKISISQFKKAVSGSSSTKGSSTTTPSAGSGAASQ